MAPRPTPHRRAVLATSLAGAALVALVAVGCTSEPAEVQPAASSVDIGPECSAALGAVRSIMTAHDGGTLTSELRDALREALDAPYSSCTQEEYARFTRDELNPWGERLVRDGS